MRTRALLLLVSCAACRGPDGGGLSGAEPKVAVAPAALAFGGVYIGAQATQSIAVINSGAGGDEVSWSLAGDTGFSVTSPSPFAIAGGGTTALTVQFAPAAAGAFSAALMLVARSGTFTVALAATGLADLSCTPSSPCDEATFDPDAGICLHTAAPDGTTCSDPCLENAQCQGGACLGALVSCDDGDACTNDFCVSGNGCQHTPVTCDGECTSGACDPAIGCSGATLPDGAPCRLWWEPCVADATCTAGVCDSPTADAEVPGDLRWDAGLAGAVGPFAVDDAGAAYFVRNAYGPVGSPPGPTAVAALDACGRPLWTSDPGYNFIGVLLDGDQAVAWTYEGFVRSLDRATGATLWETELSDAGEAYLTAGAALNSAGQLVFPAVGFPSQVVALWSDGQPAWTASVGGWAPSSVAADIAGNAYVAFSDMSTTSTNVNEGHPPSSSSGTTNGWVASFVQAFDPNGRLVMSDNAAPVQTQLSVGEGFVFLGGETAIAFDGGAVYGPPANNGGGPVCWTSSIGEAGLIDASGRVLAPSQVDGTWQALGPNGLPLWGDASLFAGPATLADDGSLFALAPTEGCSQGDGPLQFLNVFAIDGATGALVWRTQLEDQQPLTTSYLALTPGGSLVFAGTNQVYAVFAGKTQPPADAPWYRSGANNANNSAANR